MDERDRVPAPPDHEGTGALTGATGNLTPDDADEAFVPAETREVSDPEASRDLTAAAHRRREARNAASGDEPGRLRTRGEDTAPNDRDGGYGSEHGLAGDDPAYAQEEHLPPEPSGPPATETRLGGDQQGRVEDEHF